MSLRVSSRGGAERDILTVTYLQASFDFQPRGGDQKCLGLVKSKNVTSQVKISTTT
jgi:hypothetical protein